ncbi:GNAT family N-acetyltransferase [Isoptericola sp. NPDC057391]|uniref:GNAT family N-acetyltransferase n=1 Tax=Isoptericola sp. NPDC057391 TaxID=3346117 RepID=UPI00362E421F
MTRDATPPPTARLRFRAMGPADLDEMAALLGDPDVMAYYPAPKTRAEAAAWIAWNQENYARHGHGLWILETLDGAFVGDCGLTWQRVGEDFRLEVGYHVRRELQGRGFATEAAAACRDVARDVLGARELVAIVHPDNTASRRVAEKLGMRHVADDTTGPVPVRTVMGMDLRART